MGKTYNFDELVIRKGTSCLKHDNAKNYFGTDDLIPMWIADMDLKTPDFVMDALRRRCDNEALGYTFAPDTYVAAVIRWLHDHYGIDTDRSCLNFIPGIVKGIAFAIQAFTAPGDHILMTTPVYPPFLNVSTKNRRILNISRLMTVNGRFEIDFDDFDRKAEGCKLFILSNPHNPGGVVWTEEELKRMAGICEKHHVLVVSDEIHADLTLPGFRHTSFTKVSAYAHDNTITFIAPSKTFNIPGLGSSITYVPGDELRKEFFGYLECNEFCHGNVFAFVGAEAAFANGDDWLKQLLAYIEGNIDLVESYLKENLPMITMMRPEASFLIWLDFNKTGLGHEEIKHKLAYEAKVGFNDGMEYGEQCAGFMRMNIGTTRAVVKEALDRMAKVFKK